MTVIAELLQAAERGDKGALQDETDALAEQLAGAAIAAASAPASAAGAPGAAAPGATCPRGPRRPRKGGTASAPKAKAASSATRLRMASRHCTRAHP